MAAEWAPAQRWLHWATAGLVAAGFGLAWVMTSVPFRQMALKFWLYQAHKSIGLLVLLAVVARLVLRTRLGRPATELPPNASAWAATGHAVLYILLLTVPLLGVLTADTAPLRIPTLFLGLLPLPVLAGRDPALFAVLVALHRALAIALVVLAFGHAGMALRHHAAGRGVMAAMRGRHRAL